MVVGFDIKNIIEQKEYENSNELLQASSTDGPMNSAWSMFCYDVKHTSQSPYSTADNPGIEKWRFKTQGWVEGGATIDNDGILYFGDFSYYLYALFSGNMTLKWKYRAEETIWDVPAIDEDGTIYFGCMDRRLYAINPNGTRKWRVNCGGAIVSPPTICDDGTIYFGTMMSGSSGNSIVAVYPNGTIKWKYQTNGRVTGSPAIGDDGSIYCGSGDNYLYALNSNGTLKWRFKTGDLIKGSTSIANDGTIYIGSWDDYLYALYPNGTMKWKCKIGQGTETNPSIASDGTIYVGSYDGHLYAVYPNGTMKWSFSVKGNIHQSSPTISADGTIYFGTDDSGYIYAVNPDGTEKWKKKISKLWVESSPCISEDGTIYIGSTSDDDTGMPYGYLHAFGSQESNDPPEAPVIDGPTEGKINKNYDFEFVSTDPDSNPISYYVNWGDGTNSGWTMDVNTGESVTLSHKWTSVDDFTITARTKDTFGLESDTTSFEIKISNPRTRTSSHWMQLLDMFPVLQRILNYI